MSPFAKNLAGLLAVAAVAGGLGLYAYFGVMKQDEAEAQRKDKEERLFAAPEPAGPDAGAAAGSADFTSLEVEAKGERAKLSKQDGQWRLTEPVAAAADKVTVEALLSQLQTAKLKGVVEERPTDAELQKYGLTPPKFTVRAKAQLPGGGEQEVVLHGGIENTFDGSVYLRREGDPKVYAAEGGVRWSLEKTPLELRDKEVLAVDEAGVQKIELESKAATLTLERVDAAAWRLTRPQAAAADGPAVSALFSALKAERATAFPKDSPEERRRLSLEAPAVDATFTFSSGAPVRIRIAEATVDGAKRTFALREAEGASVLAEVSGGLIPALAKKPQELKDRSLLSFKKDEVAKVTFTPPGKGAPVVVQRVHGDAGATEDWQVLAPSSGPAKKFKLSSVLWTLESLKASAVGEERPKDWRRYGLAEGAQAVTLADASGKALARLVLGKDVPGKGGIRYARGSRDAVMEVDAARLSELPTTAADVLDSPPPAALDAGAQPGVGAN